MTTVKRTTSWRHVQDGDQGHAIFTYDTADPYVVTVDFGADKNGGRIVWAVARDLLADGFTAPAGFGDFRCYAHGIHYFMALTSSEGHAVLSFIAEQIRAFLIDAEDAVPYGREELDFDAELDALLKDGAR